ncbi:MAG: zinc/iron-chelating domain-containing protein [Nitrospinae bacterium CG11_big_fil_rev_8_21_14_0_20_56_8]|nr:MAG: zinc/iron-chelating domain-containing protein [Nitrospinae bacterium CG11_big_fil_rev_8_21_14_0_20_56_8]
MAKWWEKEPLRFECQADCFKCCLKPGIVYFDDEDVRRVAAYLNCSIRDFKQKYLVREDGYWLHRVEENRPCSFLTFEGCHIHPVKPKQCQTYPFWRELLATKNDWKLAEGFCPGIGRGPMVLVETVRAFLKKFDL